MQTNRSNQLFLEAKNFIPGGVNSPVRSFSGVGGNPLFIASAKGSKVTDVDGNTYIDYVQSWGPMILGHAHPEVLEAIQQTMQKGLSFGAPTELETILAKRITQMVPSMEMVRMVNSGTEATMSAIRVARGFTGRDKIIKFTGCYHGHADYLLVQAGSGAATHGAPTSPGVPKAFAAETLLAKFNDFEEVQALVEEYPGEIACIILEPIPGNMGVVPPKNDFLQKLRQLCDLNGILLIFDEVMSGFRAAKGGAQELYHIVPDLTTLGKVIGGGMPVGAYGGRKDIMAQVSPSGKIYQAGTLSGNPVAMAAGLKTLELIDRPGFYEDLGQKVTWLTNEMRDTLEKSGLPYQLAAVGSMFGFFFSKEEVINFEVAQKQDVTRFGNYFRQMLTHGVYMAPSAFEAAFMSQAHTQEDLEKTAQAFKASIQAVKG